MKLKDQFEARASEMGYPTRKNSHGEYEYKFTGQLWNWYLAGAKDVPLVIGMLDHADDPNYRVECTFNHPYEG